MALRLRNLSQLSMRCGGRKTANGYTSMNGAFSIDLRPKKHIVPGTVQRYAVKREDLVQTCRISRVLCAAAVAALVVEPASAQARIGGNSAGGGGIRSGGSLGATRGRVSGMTRAGARFGARPSGTTTVRTTGAGAAVGLHRRGYIGRTGSGSGATQPVPPRAPFPTGFNDNGGEAPTPGRARRLAQVGGSIRRQLITVPRAMGIPPLGNSIPPLEPAGGRTRTALISGHGLPGRHGRYRFRTGFLPHFPVVFVPLGYGRYGGYTEHHIVVVGHETPTHSRTSYQRTPEAPAATEPEPPIEPKLYEVRPEEPGPTGEPVSGGGPAQADPPEGSPTQGEVDSIEMIRGGEVADRADSDTLYLIAFKNGSVVVSRRHWLEGSTLHYVTPSEQRHQVKLADVDLGLTARLNRERGVIFQIEVLPEDD